MNKEKIRTRIAPSPTGQLHVGTIRTALFNELFAHNNGGEFVVRIEDTDKERSEKKYEKVILEGLKWLSLEWQEGPDIGGSYGPYRQSERLDLYRKAISQLLDSGAAYLTDEGTVKLRIEPEEIHFNDLIRGDVKVHTDSWGGDFIIARSADDPVYHLAVVVDDAAQEISHVIRGEEHLTNTARHILIQRALGVSTPKYAHLPLLLDKKRRKLSKRAGDVGLLDFKRRGFLPEAMLNYLALLGWNPKNDKEFFSHEELQRVFSLDGIQKGGAVFDEVKLNSINRHYLGLLSDEDYGEWEKEGLKSGIKNFLDKTEDEQKKWEAAIRTEKGRIGSYHDLEQLLAWADPDWKIGLEDEGILLRKGKYEKNEVMDKLQKVESFLGEISDDEFSEANLQEKTLAWIDNDGLDRGEVLWPMRVALTGREHSPGPFEVSEALGKKTVMERLKEARRLLGND